MQPPARITVSVPAKLNLGLAVGARRPDGFHPLDTVFTALDLCDTVTAGPAERFRLEVHGPEAGTVPADSGNLAWQAAALLAAHTGRAATGTLVIDKRIPVAAGLAGGSADAAGALLACRALWQLDTGTDELLALATRLGSDVSFALTGGTARGTGRGELLQPLVAPALHWVLAAAAGQLSTAAVYAEFDRQPPAAPDPVLAHGLLAAVRAGDPAALAPLLRNDLQPAALALAPYLRDTLAAGQAAGALAGLVSGSGPTCAFLAADAGHARQLAEQLAADCRFAVAVTSGHTPTVEAGS
ncbi:MAG TPA: 4-(cytidine 5'-diphospho)-2-C-methyl-D-erythritol kinase [Jatrophihabitans sp.]|nr:4-(cytidine 5'-diphospho)-2-C-methyl-D-erythritol kinase [Jatrophihabitans sp.]